MLWKEADFLFSHTIVAISLASYQLARTRVMRTAYLFGYRVICASMIGYNQSIIKYVASNIPNLMCNLKDICWIKTQNVMYINSNISLATTTKTLFIEHHIFQYQHYSYNLHLVSCAYGEDRFVCICCILSPNTSKLSRDEHQNLIKDY